jgi:hypothetical protein
MRGRGSSELAERHNCCPRNQSAVPDICRGSRTFPAQCAHDILGRTAMGQKSSDLAFPLA